MKRPRAPLPVRRMGTEVLQDRRTRRLRTRSEEERAALEEAERDLDEELQYILDWYEAEGS
jgi:hypothetical protein